jgi:hypothetical protein
LIVYAATLLALAAGAIHLYVMPEHWREYWAYGLFFLVVGVVQVVGGMLLPIRGGRGLYWAGVAGTLLVILFYLATRTLRVPLGPDAGEREAVSAIDVASKVVEVLFIVSLLALLRQRREAATKGAAG